jgi:hypothetical protein
MRLPIASITQRPSRIDWRAIQGAPSLDDWAFPGFDLQSLAVRSRNRIRDGPSLVSGAS